MLYLALVAAAISLVAGIILIKIKLPQSFYDSDTRGVQKFHTDKRTPRVGGMAIFCGFALTLAAFLPGAYTFTWIGFVFLALLVGLVEDFFKQVPPWARLLLSFVAAFLTCYVFNTGFSRSGWELVDAQLLSYRPVAIAVAIIMLGGVMHSINLIDGYNGLSSGISVMVLLGMFGIAMLVGDTALAILAFVLVCSIAGFMFLNYPFGRIFIGDGGAYMIGYVIATLALLLVGRNPQVSPWFPLMLVALPVWETLFSMARRRIFMRRPATEPDVLHLHNLVYSKLVSLWFARRSATFKNSAVAPVMWVFALLGIIPAMLFWDNTPALFASALAFVFVYCLSYFTLSRA